MDLKIDHPAYMLGGGSGGSGELRGGSNGESSHDISRTRGGSQSVGMSAQVRNRADKNSESFDQLVRKSFV